MCLHASTQNPRKRCSSFTVCEWCCNVITLKLEMEMYPHWDPVSEKDLCGFRWWSTKRARTLLTLVRICHRLNMLENSPYYTHRNWRHNFDLQNGYAVPSRIWGHCPDTSEHTFRKKKIHPHLGKTLSCSNLHNMHFFELLLGEMPYWAENRCTCN